MALNRHLEVRIGAHQRVGILLDEAPFREFVPHPANETLSPAIRE